MKNNDYTEIWRKYENGLNHHRRIGIFDKTQKNYNFYEGRQWEGVKGINPEQLPFYNITKQIADYKINMISMNKVELNYFTDNEMIDQHLNAYAEATWETMKIPKTLWRMNKEAAISGDSYLYFHDESPQSKLLQPKPYDSLKTWLIDNIDVFLADEQDSNLQEQPYIIIRKRMFVDEVKKIAKANGVDVNLITSDEEETEARPNLVEVQNENGRCTTLLYLEKRYGKVYFSWSTKNVVYHPETDSQLELYPLVNLLWIPKKWTARGIGEVSTLIPNQIALNKNLYRREKSIEQVAFPKTAYHSEHVADPSELSKSGGMIKLTGAPNFRVSELIQYLQPAYIGNDAKELNDELITQTKEISNSGNGALGQVNPERASGTAIQAVTQQANISLNEQQYAYHQMVEDIGLVLIEIWKKYNPQGILTNEMDEQGNSIIIPPEALNDVDMQINISPATPYDRAAMDFSLIEMFKAGQINFEELVMSLDDSTYLPKAKLEKIAEQRDAINQMKAQYEEIIQQQASLLAQIEVDEQTQAALNPQVSPEINI